MAKETGRWEKNPPAKQIFLLVKMYAFGYDLTI